MVFSSVRFLIFFALVIPLYYLVPKKIQWQFTLAASIVFYMSEKPELILLLMALVGVNYICGILIEALKNKKAVLIIGLLINFGLLTGYKYLGLISDGFRWIYSLLGLSYPLESFSIALPLGISFYTFQAAGYLIDVYRGEYESQKSFWKFAAFICYFPLITSGPIERGAHLMGQLYKPKHLKAENVSMGLKIMLWGYFKKLVIAERLAVLVNTVYGKPREFQGLALIIATLCFTVQIYCDFSGYSDMARGCARVMGVDLINNFDRPYFATSIRDFWRRWHISLSTWFRDYLYIPLGGSRVGKFKHWLNYLITFAVSGLWHGASLTYVVWGLIHGIYQIIGNIKYIIFGKPQNSPFLKLLSIIITFLLVSFGWIFFKASTVSDGIYIATHLFENISAVGDKQYLYEMLNSLGLNLFELVVVAIAVVYLILCELISYKYEINELMTRLPFVIRFGFYYVTCVFLLATGVFSGGGEFIYFQF